MAARPALDALADRLGVAAGYTALTGERRAAATEARVAVLAAMGVDASSEAAAARALAELDRVTAARLVAPAQVAVAGPKPQRLRLRVAGRMSVSWHLELIDEHGQTSAATGRSVSRRDGHFDVALPITPDPGYHLVRVEARTAEGSSRGEQRLIVTPATCYTLREAIGPGRAFGVIANLYALRSARNWGAGDLTDLSALVAWAGERRAAFVGLNPLHALKNRGWGVSPYSPVSRLFRNVLYLDPEATPEWSHCPAARERVAAPGFHSALERVRAADKVDYETVMALKRQVLEVLYRTFVERHRDGRTPRGRAYARYREAQGAILDDFATFLALETHFAEQSGISSWRRWPEPYRDPRSPEVLAFRRSAADAIEMHCYLQFELDRQLAEVARRGREAELTVGIYQDLAVGTDRDGSDPWAFPQLFADGASVGAPPDDYSAAGQDWGFPPVDPRRLAEQGYEYWVRLLRAAFAHSGALRIDHAMGLTRQFWVPRGLPASEGCYVRYPARELLGILALESRRHRAFVIGEDLGTVPRGFASLLARWGILSSQVLYFEREPSGVFRAPSRYSARALVTATTHDHAPLAGYRHSRDLELRRAAGQISSDAKLERARAERAEALAALTDRLRAAGLWPKGDGVLSDSEFVAAVHAFLARTRAPLVGVYVDDLLREVESVNLPGVGPDRYPSWTRRVGVGLAQLRDDPAVVAALGDLPDSLRE